MRPKFSKNVSQLFLIIQSIIIKRLTFETAAWLGFLCNIHLHAIERSEGSRFEFSEVAVARGTLAPTPTNLMFDYFNEVSNLI
jgi:hypothetical protein